MDTTAAVIIAIVVYGLGLVFGLLVLAAVIRYAVRKGIEDVLYKKGKDGLWSAEPGVVAVAKEIAAASRDPRP
ncbi:hypothetical protein SCB71_12475 [Herbiconiux sp. KACC 21604]|uniref:hypothetical protein n=1 Tax=unclassified Herbiconiux TaxID=2618217 RepID=UPI001491EE24|nr:hypothetical protein [Herbiconiux sp. SALV-R1]QJU53999.1 hypothetical protein HL652_10425 [Herbiconiux sp. SALV-R1]WPO85028.1 hypothetical protein SCB71_12475 [Herbiconiux sp. KACC 21604]